MRPAPRGSGAGRIAMMHACACACPWTAQADDVLDLGSTHARFPRLLRGRTPSASGGHRRSLARSMVVGTAVVLLGFLVCGCMAGDPQFTADRPANFWLGLWHGAISWIALVAGLFVEGVQVYERNNTGGWYDFGFLLGATSIWGGGSSAGYHRSRRSRRRERREADTII